MALVFLLGLSFFLFGDAAASGPNQVALVFCSILAIAVAWRHGHSIDELRDAAVASVTAGLSAIFILLSVGALIGTWALSGTLIAMVYYGLQLLNPDYFYPTACLICLVVAVSIGSSWTVAGTIGIGLMGVAAQDGARPGDHRRRDHLRRLFRRQALAALRHRQPRLRRRRRRPLRALRRVAADLGAGAPRRARALLEPRLAGRLRPCGVTARHRGGLPPVAAALPPARPRARAGALRWPPFVAIFLGALAGGVLAVVDAPGAGGRLRRRRRLPHGLALLKGVWAALATGYVSTTGEPAVDQLLTRGGMASMLGTVWLILVALAFGGIVEKAGVLDRLIGPLIAAARSVGALVATLVGAAFATNVLASDQYIAVVLPGRMFRPRLRGARARAGGAVARRSATPPP